MRHLRRELKNIKFKAYTKEDGGIGLTEKELNQLYYLNREYERLKKDIKERKDKLGYKSPVLSDMPKGGNKRDYTDEIADIADLEAAQSENLERIQFERLKLEKYIGKIRDSEIRLIMRLRHINGMTWREIGNETYMSYETVRGKYKTYLKDLTKLTR